MSRARRKAFSLFLTSKDKCTMHSCSESVASCVAKAQASPKKVGRPSSWCRGGSVTGITVPTWTPTRRPTPLVVAKRQINCPNRTMASASLIWLEVVFGARIKPLAASWMRTSAPTTAVQTSMCWCNPKIWVLEICMCEVVDKTQARQQACSPPDSTSIGRFLLAFRRERFSAKDIAGEPSEAEALKIGSEDVDTTPPARDPLAPSRAALGCTTPGSRSGRMTPTVPLSCTTVSPTNSFSC
mmetsp:Transcript_82306/g.266473  ORF Transcript_82306/g.266473 Transcript_82306/m.266473 type:complete len:241 (+) Transcript_82306:3539-4261(+)